MIFLSFICLVTYLAGILASPGKDNKNWWCLAMAKISKFVIACHMIITKRFSDRKILSYDFEIMSVQIKKT